MTPHNQIKEALQEMYDSACTNATSTPSKKAFLMARAALSAQETAEPASNVEPELIQLRAQNLELLRLYKAVGKLQLNADYAEIPKIKHLIGVYLAIKDDTTPQPLPEQAQELSDSDIVAAFDGGRHPSGPMLYFFKEAELVAIVRSLMGKTS